MGPGPLFLLATERAMNLEQHIEEIITSPLLHKGLSIVRVQLQGSKRKTLQIMIEHKDGSSVTADECAIASHTVSILLDVEDPIHESYVLEISSPGLDRPLVKMSDFERFVGLMIKGELNVSYEGSRRFRGVLLGVEGDNIKIELAPQKKVAEFAFSDIQKAKLIPDYETSRSS